MMLALFPARHMIGRPPDLAWGWPRGHLLGARPIITPAPARPPTFVSRGTLQLGKDLRPPRREGSPGLLRSSWLWASSLAPPPSPEGTAWPRYHVPDAPAEGRRTGRDYSAQSAHALDRRPVETSRIAQSSLRVVMPRARGARPAAGYAARTVILLASAGPGAQLARRNRRAGGPSPAGAVGPGQPGMR